MRLLLAFTYFFLLLTQAATAGPMFQMTIKKPICNVELAIPFTVEPAGLADDGSVRISGIFDLTDLYGKTDAIVRACGVDRDEHCGTKLTYNGTLYHIDAEQLSAKVHFNGGKQFCKRIIGVEATSTQRSNGSISVAFALDVHDGRVSLRHGPPTLAISNDLVRTILEATGLDQRLETLIAAALDNALADPKAMFQLPPQAAALGVRIVSARFEQRGAMPTAIVDGVLPAAAAVFLTK